MAHEVVVTVSGPMNSGKTTVSRLIKEALDGAGISCTVHDEKDSILSVIAHQPKRVMALKEKGLRVTLHQVQLNREAKTGTAK